MKLAKGAFLIAVGFAVLFLIVFFDIVGLAAVISRQTPIQMGAVAISQIVVGIAEVIIAFAIGMEAAMTGSRFLLNAKTSITRN